LITSLSTPENTKMKNFQLENQKWTLTDPSTNQLGCQLTETTFEFMEDGKERQTIELGDYSKDEIESCIRSYGYTQGVSTKRMTNIEDLYGKQSNWIIAECLYETN